MTKPQEVLKFKRKKLSKEELEKIRDDHIREVGRPSRMDDPEYRQQICATVELLGSEGRSPCEIAAAIEVDKRTMDYWAEQHPEFSLSITRAKLLEQAWWEHQARTNLNNKNFNAALWFKAASARFKDYKQDPNLKVELTGKDGSAIEINHNHAVVMDTTRRILAILGEAEHRGQIIDSEPVNLLDSGEDEDE